jgi:hypothetical protein
MKISDAKINLKEKESVGKEESKEGEKKIKEKVLFFT